MRNIMAVIERVIGKAKYRGTKGFVKDEGIEEK